MSLAIANSVALHANTRRYTTGTVRGGLDLDYERDWWWLSLPDFLGANAVWVIGSVSFFTLLWFALRNVNSVDARHEFVVSSLGTDSLTPKG